MHSRIQNNPDPMVLVNCDDETSSLLSENLPPFGFNVLEAREFTAAKNMVQNENPIAILLDTDSEHIPGISFCRFIRKELQRDLALFILSNDVDSKQHIDAFRAGADSVIGKPVSLRLVLAQIENAARRKPQTQPHFNTAERKSKQQPEALAGSLGTFPAVDVMQFLNQAQKSGIAHFQNDRKRGSIHFEKGEIVFAKAEGEKGLGAVQVLSNWHEGSFHFLHEVPNEPANIHIPTMKLFIDLCSW